MTREEARKVFLSRGYIEVKGGSIFDANKWRESCRVISEWLLEQEPCEDTISRQTVLNELSKITRYGILGVSEESDGVWYKADEVEKMLKKLPPVTPQPKNNENLCSSQKDQVEGDAKAFQEVATAFQLGLSFGFIDGLNENKMQESEVDKNDET